MPTDAQTGDGAAELWARVLADLRLQMARDTFDACLAGTAATALDGDTLTVRARTPLAVAWLRHRLQATIARAVERRAGRPLGVAVLPPADDAGPEGPPPIPALAPAPAADGRARGDGPPAGADEDDDAGDAPVQAEVIADPVLAAFDVAAAGWSRLTHYAARYWAELLGSTPFLTWLVIMLDDVRRAKTPWTPLQRFSASGLARVAADGNKQAITGAWRTCRSAAMLVHDRPCPECAARGGERLAPHVCRFRRPGAFDVLQAEGVACVQRLGTGRSIVYRVRVFSALPLLTPAQAGRLHPVSQEQHDRWLRRQSLDAERWERLTVAHLALPPFET